MGLVLLALVVGASQPFININDCGCGFCVTAIFHSGSSNDVAKCKNVHLPIKKSFA